MDNKILNYVPKSKREAVKDCYKDDDGYWITLKEGWNADNMDCVCRTIHEDTIEQLRYQIAGIVKVLPAGDVVELPVKLGVMVKYREREWTVCGFECDVLGNWRVKLERFKDRYRDTHEYVKILFKTFREQAELI